MKTLTAFRALLLALAVPGCAASAPPAARVAALSQTIPFEAAAVEQRGSVRTITWTASGASGVTVHAGSSPGTIDRSRVVGRGGASGSVEVAGLPAGRQWFFELVPDRGAPVVIADRALATPSVPNLRDVGGYRAGDGRWVRMGLVYRSDQLDRVTDVDLATMETLGLGVVADLRTETERRREPDRLPRGAQHVVLDVSRDSAAGLGGDMRQAMAMIASGEGAKLLTEANREFVSAKSAQESYRELILRIAQGDAKLLFHCTAGKDRTGWGAAVLLSALGVPRETIIADYLRSNVYLEAKNAATLRALAGSGARIDPAHLEAVLTVRRAFIEAAFAEVDTRYGSFDRYLTDGLGLSSADLERLRTRMLEGRPVAA